MDQRNGGDEKLSAEAKSMEERQRNLAHEVAMGPEEQAEPPVQHTGASAAIASERELTHKEKRKDQERTIRQIILGQMRELQQQIARYEEQIRELDDRIAKLQEEITRSENALTEDEAFLEEATSLLDENGQLDPEKAAQAAALLRQRGIATDGSVAMETLLREEIDRTLQSVQAQEEQIAENSNELERAERERQNLEGKLDEAKKQLENLRREHELDDDVLDQALEDGDEPNSERTSTANAPRSAPVDDGLSDFARLFAENKADLCDRPETEDETRLNQSPLSQPDLLPS